MTQFGSLALVDEGQDGSDGKSISLPGVRKGDMSSRHWKPEVRVTGVHFSPTGKILSNYDKTCFEWRFNFCTENVQ